ncbi:MAG: O-antigen ligase family protein [Pseudomonadota bacterium]
MAVLIIIMLISLVNAILYGLSTGLVIKQTVGILLSALAYYLLIKANNYDLEKLFKMYLRFAFIICIIGIGQEISYLINFTPGHDFSWFGSTKWILTVGTGLFPLLRVNSIMTEPSVFAIVLTPAMFVALNNIIFNKSIYMNRMKSGVIMIAFLLSFSTIGYLGILGALFFILCSSAKGKSKKFVSILLTLSLAAIFVFTSYSFVPEIRARVKDTFRMLKGEELNLGNVKYSVFSLYSNLLVTRESLIRNPLFGSSLGNHVENHKKYISRIFPQYDNNPWVKVNREDANSLFLRLLSETGIFGIIIVAYFLKSFFIAGNNNKLLDDNPLYVRYGLINNGIFVFLLLRLIRHGHYFLDGLFFFAFLYYFTGKSYKKEIKIKSLQLKKNNLA